ncbi:RpiB/LacA/LacB family sugar-phosphate isomerase [Dermabacter sp. Marseille-Q3180]|uniref:RpiB/LacA/LacB family sugar-phosphate isomerase n=1 Tax=Dermabacter sp. Marseille-Q3180 TaxID=2758090 RepID=UPI002023C35A|nr:RpiB/LacA/LacB family sugar-phosphate isomerase [Dermabacter sp. Marseille-Q3180]
MRLAFGCDPNATEFKKALIAHAESLGHEVTDYPSEDPVYANVAVAVATDVAAGKFDRGVLLCGTGIGVSIAANKVRGAYCACVTDVYQAQRATLSNNANLIAMGAQVTGLESAKVYLAEYLDNTFDPNSRSGVKVDAIKNYENQ